jgi:arylsulfatase A-like enzyme
MLLDEYKNLSNTTVCLNTPFSFMSDNGAAPQNSCSNWPLQGGKHTLYEGGTKVPAFVYGLGLKPRIESIMFHITDWYPTILGAVDPIERDDRLDGVNHWEALKDENVPWPRSSIIFNIDDITKKNPEPIAVLRVIWQETGAWNGWYFPPEEKMSSHSRDDWDGFRWNGGKKKGWFPIHNTTRNGRIGATNLLLDLSKDPSEKVNLAHEYPEKVLELKNLIKENAERIKKVKDSKYGRTGSPHNGVWTTGWC